MRVFVAGLLGGVVFFVWGAVSHMVLQIGDVGFHYGTPSSATFAALAQEAPEGGIYMLPSLPRERMQDEGALKAFSAETAGKPYALVVYAPGGNPGSQDMTLNLSRQFATDVVSALVGAWLLSLLGPGFGRRVAAASALGLFAWLVVCVPYWNWYMFPLDYTLGLLAKYVAGWTIAGAAMSWWLGRGQR